MEIKNRGYQEDEKEFLKMFRELCRSRNAWEVWTDLITVMACSIVNVLDQKSDRKESREKEYANCIKRLGGVEKPAYLFALIVEALEKNPDQDFLGKLYMNLELGNHWKGQFFTPYNVSRCMAEIVFSFALKWIEISKGLTPANGCQGLQLRAEVDCNRR